MPSLLVLHRRQAPRIVAVTLTLVICVGAATNRDHPAKLSTPGLHTDSSTQKIVASDSTTFVVMRNVDFLVDPMIALHISHLTGTIRSKLGGPVNFDDKRSFVLYVDTAQVALDGRDVTTLLNKYVFGYPGAPLQHLRVTIGDGQLRMSGELHKGVEIPFEIRATVAVTPEGMLRIHPVRTTIFRVSGEALMRALGLSLQKLIDVSKATGVTVHGNDIIIDPLAVLPPPTIHGHVSKVGIAGDRLVQTFSPSSGIERLDAPSVSDTTARNFMYYRGGSLHFGRLTMANADMLIIDLDPEDPFEFDLDRYAEQLVAGYSRTLSNFRLEVFMPDVGKLRRHGVPPGATPVRPR